MDLRLLFARIRAGLGRLVHRPQHEREMDDEMRFHMDMEAADLVRAGVPPEEAHRKARGAFGGAELHKEVARDHSGVRALEDAMQDIRYALRQLRAAPGFTLATLLTLGLGIGATTTMYTITYRVLHPPLGLPQSDRLVYLRQYHRLCPNCGQIAAGNYVAIRDGAPSLASASAFQTSNAVLRVGDGAEAVRTARVTPDFFVTLGVSAILGRALAATDTAIDRRAVAVLGETAWRARFGADSGIVGKTVFLDAKPFIVVGVLSAQHVYPPQTELWTPLVFGATDAQERSFADARYAAIGRLKDGATLAHATAELQALAARAAAELPKNSNGMGFAATPLSELVTVPSRELTTVDSAVTLVLLIACINLAGLLVARLSARRRELAVRAAIGAAAGRIARQLLTESVLLAIIGGLLGAAVASWGIVVIRDAVPVDAAATLPAWGNLRLDLRGLGIALSIATATGLIIGVWPALRFARGNPLEELRIGPSASSQTRGSTRGRRALVTVEIAFTIVLLTAAGLLTRTARNAVRAPLGFRGDHVLTLRVQLPRVPRDAPGDPAAFDNLAQRLRELPGAESAGAGSGLPLDDNTIYLGFTLQAPSGLVSDGAQTRPVTPGYFNVLKIPLIVGRAFAATDDYGAPRVAIVNQRMVSMHFQGRDPIGSIVTFDSTAFEIVGVVGDVSYNGPQKRPEIGIYYPLQQSRWRTAAIAVRVAGDPAPYANQLARTIRAWNADAAITSVRTMDKVTDEFMALFRIMAGIMFAFAIAAAIISAIGLYGIMSYSVAQRTREFGVRLALGAERRALLALVLGEGLRLAGLGIGIGVLGALAVTRLIGSFLYGVSPFDPATLTVVCAGACALALAAAYIPARRATRVDPVLSLRAE